MSGSTQTSRPETAITVAIARRIVERIAGGLENGETVGVTDLSGRVVAANSGGWLDLTHPLARQALDGGGLVESDAAEWHGAAAPLVYDDALVGALVIQDEPAHAREIARLSRTLAELVLYQSLVVERPDEGAAARDRVVADLLYGRLSEARAPAEAARHGIDLAVPRIVVALDAGEGCEALLPPGTASGSLPVIAGRRRVTRARAALRAAIERGPGPARGDVPAVVDDRWLVVLVAVEAARPEAGRRRAGLRARRLLELAERTFGGRLAAGTSAVALDDGELPRAWAEARFAATAGARLRGPGTVSAADDLGLPRFLANGQGLSADVAAARLVRAIAAEPNLLSSLIAFLRGNLSPSAAAESLGVHRHTLGYRLDKIARLTGLDPRRFDQAAQLYAALLLVKLSGEIELPDDVWAGPPAGR